MKINLTFAWVALGLVLGGATAPGGLTLRAAESEAGPAAAKPYTLFMGADVWVERDQELHRVRGVAGGSVILDAKRGPILVPIDRGAFGFKIEPWLTLAMTAAAVERFKYDRVFTAGNDPGRRFAAEQAGAGSSAANAAAEAASYQAQQGVNQAQAFARSQAGTAGAALGAKVVAAAEQNALAASARQMNVSVATMSEANQIRGHASRIEQGEAGELYDALEITFELSAQVPLRRPYVVVDATIHEPGAAASQVRKWMYAKELAPVDRVARAVYLKSGGLPPGFEIRSLQLRLYDAGEEVPTSLSPNRVALSADDAFQYELIQYRGRHKAATSPAAPLSALLPALVRECAAGGDRRSFFVRVSREGRALGVSLDEQGREPVADAALRQALLEMRFCPAFERGLAVESVMRLKFSDLPQTM